MAAQYWGKQDKESVEEVLCIALKISFLISLLFFMAAFFFPQVLMRIFTNEILLIEAGISYLRIVSWSYLFMGFSQIYLCIMKNSGRTIKSTIYGSSALLLNILLNAVFIFGLFGFPQKGIEKILLHVYVWELAQEAVFWSAMNSAAVILQQQKNTAVFFVEYH